MGGDDVTMLHTDYFSVLTLPRLSEVSGLPVTEDALSDFYDPNAALDGISLHVRSCGGGIGGGNGVGLGGSGGDGGIGSTVASRMATAMGLDRTFALAQALSSSKAVQTSQEARIMGLVEKNSILKERLVEVEGVLMRWRDEIHKTPSSKDTPAVSAALQEQTVAIYAGSEENARLNLKIQELSARVLSLQEDNIESVSVSLP